MPATTDAEEGTAGPAPGMPGCRDVMFESTVSPQGRSFVVQVHRFENGVFAAISENSRRLGSLAVSLVSRAGADPVTTTIIPPRDPTCAFLMRMAAEQISSRTRGIAAVSVYADGEIGAPASKELLEVLVGMITPGGEKDGSA